MKLCCTSVALSIAIVIAGTVVAAPSQGGKPAAHAPYPVAKRLTKLTGSQRQPCWGPGDKIAYADDDEGNGLWTMNADGSGAHRLPRENGISDYQPSWGADGKIAFVGALGSSDIYIMDADGGNRKKIWDYSTDDLRPRLSKSGKVAFCSDKDHPDHTYDIWVMNEDGSNPVKITHDDSNLNPCWNADGTRIVFNSFHNGHNNIYVMNADGSNVKQLTKGNGPDYDPSWGPDGRIAFVSERDGEGSEIYINE